MDDDLEEVREYEPEIRATLERYGLSGHALEECLVAILGHAHRAYLKGDHDGAREAMYEY